MQEKHITHRVQAYLSRMEAHSWRHEDYRKGVPDISFQLPTYAGGWIECKVLQDDKVKDPNVKLSTVIKLTEPQRRWMIQRSQAGGYCCIIAARDHFWIHFNQYIIDHFPRLTLAKALSIGSVFKDDETFSSVLTRDMDFRAHAIANDINDEGGTRKVFGKPIREYPHSVTVEKRKRKLDQRQQVFNMRVDSPGVHGLGGTQDAPRRVLEPDEWHQREKPFTGGKIRPELFVPRKVGSKE